MRGISVLIPVRGNRDVTVTVESVIRQKLPLYEILVLRNGQQEYAEEKPYSQPEHVRVLHLTESGKGKALNQGIRAAAYDLIAVVDADCSLADKAIQIAMRHFDDPSVLAVGGKLCVRRSNKNILVAIQSVEYTKIFNLWRRWFNSLHGDCVISGAFGIFRKDALNAIGGYDEDTVGEDMELILRMQRELHYEQHMGRIVYDKSAICFTDAPASLRRLMRQRDRWQRGLLDCIFKHAKMLLNPKYGMLGMVSLPYQVIFELLGPIMIISGLLGIWGNLVPPWVLPAYIGMEILISISAEYVETKSVWKCVIIFLKILSMTVLSFVLQVIMSLSRIYGMITFPWRKTVW